MTGSLTARKGPRASERASGLLPTVFGLAILLIMVGLSVNVALGLWSRSTTESIAYEAARRVATAPPGADSSVVRADALDRACAKLGTRCPTVELHFLADAGDPMVGLRVVAPGVALLPRFIAGGGPVVAGVDRTIRMNREAP